MAFISGRDGRIDVYVSLVDGSDVRRMTDTPAVFEGPPQWTDGGRLIAFDTAGAQFTKSAILVVSESGGEVRQLGILDGAVSLITRTDRVLHTRGDGRASRLWETNLMTGQTRPLTDSSASIRQMVYSPDGSQIAFIRIDSTGRQVWVMSSDGTGARPVTNVRAMDGSAERPAWSPDGRRLAFQTGIADPQARRVGASHIWTVDIVSGALKKLAEHDPRYSDTTPAWFPDGRTIAFTSDRSGRREIWFMSADGTDLRQVTR